ncbi:MAG TPA: Stk1 family PASTA domain-containing Ser/Thr kinase, partial [Thermomicrobiales bacterium]|nr:Stk1 family PASTA domain-containing Ser/Thr kinase [Thermomicrobiales bacterium]
GRYRLGEVLGEGGMAVVYRAQDVLLNRPVAVKILRAQYASDESFLRRFEREAQAAAGFSHANIVNVYDVGTDGDQHYIVMEYIRGPSLKDLIRRQGPFSVDGAIFIIGQVTSALDYAHQRGLIHRDIKPQNILVDRDGNAKVVDFGIAKGMRDVNLTEAGTGMGTVHYVSPEQAQGDPAGPASDLYSTGVVLFEMLTKRLPFEADTPVGVAMQHVNTPPPPPSTFNPKIPPEVDAIVLRSLAKDPTERYPSGAALSTALRHWDMPPPTHSTFADRPMDPTPQPGGTTALPPRMRTAPPPPRNQPRPDRRGQAGPPRQSTGKMPVVPASVPPVRGASRAAYPAYPTARPAPRSNRDDLGCVTWLIGSAILLGIVGLVVLAFKLGPGAFASDSEPTSTTQASTPTATAALVTATATTPPAAPTATTAPQQPTATVATAPQPTATATIPAGSVPSLTNLTRAQAENTIGDTWMLNVVEEFSSSISEGVVISQDPAPGETLPLGETITIVVSRGTEIVSIPDVRGEDEAEAAGLLESLGFVVETINEPSSSVAAGLVIRTQPVTEAPSGSIVTLVISSGPSEMVVVPYVYGEDVEDAVEILEEAGLIVNQVTPLSCERILLFSPSFDCDEFPDGGVVTSTLAWESEVPIGSPIDITWYDDDL